LLRRSATIQADKMTAIIVKDVGVSIVKKVKDKILEKGENIVENIIDKIEPSFEMVKDKAKPLINKFLGWLGFE
jgi:CRISPR/Cas system type I-B associated protein Csh2 (Cas7 group RAMP superfamily)